MRPRDITIQKIDENGLYGDSMYFDSWQQCSSYLGHNRYYVRIHVSNRDQILIGKDGLYAIVALNGEAGYSESLLTRIVIKNSEKLENALRKHLTYISSLTVKQNFLESEQEKTKKKLNSVEIRKRQEKIRKELLAEKVEKFLAVREALLKIDPTLRITQLEETSPELYDLRKAYGMTDDEIKRITLYNIKKQLEADARHSKGTGFRNMFISDSDKAFLRQHEKELAEVLR